MSEPSKPTSTSSGRELGKTRTWWHPLLVRLLSHELASGYEVVDEVPVGKMPLRVDILLIRRENGRVSEAAERELAVLLPVLNRFTLVEFKGPTDVLERGDFAQLVGCSFLWHSQQPEAIDHEEISLIVLVPAINDAFREELRSLGCEVNETESGMFRIVGVPFTAWLVETDVMARRGEPVLSLVSRIFLSDRRRIMVELERTGHAPLLHYMLQQVQQFRSLGEDFAMQHKDSQLLDGMQEDILASILRDSPAEMIRRIVREGRLLQAIPAEEILQAVPAEEILQAIPAEEILQAIPAEKLARLRELLKQERGN